MIIKRPLHAITLSTALVAFGTQADVESPSVPVSRYVSAVAEPTSTQRDVLNSIIDVSFPERVTLVGQAVEYVLPPYGYRLEVDDETSASQLVLLTLPLPDPHRTLGPITVRDVLDVLGGESFELTINPVRRTIEYRLKEGYEDYISEEDIEIATLEWQLASDSIQRSSQRHPLSASRHDRQYGPVTSGDTLSQIAQRFSLNGLTLDQAVAAIYDRNPQAFLNGNMNHLRVGAKLVIPMFRRGQALSPSKATRLVEQHHQAWTTQKASK